MAQFSKPGKNLLNISSSLFEVIMLADDNGNKLIRIMK
jgi:hypothetical protein